MDDALGTFFIIFGACGGLSLIIWTAAKAKIARIQAEYQIRTGLNPISRPNDMVLEELRTLAKQLGDMQNTSHQFDIAFDEALHRLETRVSRIESQAPTQRADLGGQAQTQRVGVQGGTAD